MATPSFAMTGGANPHLNAWLSNRIDGKMHRALKIERDSLIASLRATGLAQPATILNFNPVPCVTDGGIVSMVPKVPSCKDEAVKESDRIVFTHKGRKFRATVLTIAEPLIFPWIKDVKKEEDVEVGVYDMRACKQIEMAHVYMAQYTEGTRNSTMMGGVVAFEGTRRVLSQPREGGAAGIKIKVPRFITLPNKSREYLTEEDVFERVCARVLDMQQKYCQAQTQQAQAYWDQEDQRANITMVHRVWHEYELEMGWRQNPAPWVTLAHDNAKTCEGCGEPQKRITAFFCHKCARPYDPLEAYLAGEIGIEHPAMNRITKAEDWAKVQEQEKIRKARREGAIN